MDDPALKFTTHIPNDDDDLASRIMDYSCDHEGPMHVVFSADVNTPWSSVARVLRVARDGLGVEIDRMTVMAMIFLKGYEDTTPMLPSDPMLLRTMKKFKVSLAYQLAPKQMNVFSILISQSTIEHLDLKMYQHRTEAFLTEDPAFIALRKEVGDTFLVSLPGLQTPHEKRDYIEGAEGRQLARALIEAAGGTMRIENGGIMDQPTPQNALVVHNERFVTVRPDMPPIDLHTVPRCMIHSTGTNTVSIGVAPGVVADNRFLSTEDEDTTLRAFLITPLPDSLKVLNLQITFPRFTTPEHTRFITRCHNLQELTLNYCSITDDTMVHLAREIGQLPNLGTLAMNRNRLTDTTLLDRLIGPSLHTLSLIFNPLTGTAISGLLAALQGNSVLSRVDLDNTNIREGCLSFNDLDRWTAPNAHLRLPSLFTAEEIDSIAAVMPDGGNVEFASVFRQKPLAGVGRIAND